MIEDHVGDHRVNFIGSCSENSFVPRVSEILLAPDSGDYVTQVPAPKYTLVLCWQSEFFLLHALR